MGGNMLGKSRRRTAILPVTGTAAQIARIAAFFVTFVAVLMTAGAVLAQTILFNPSESMPNEPEFTLSIDIDCGAAAVKGVEVKVAFDPFLVHLDAITPGDWYDTSGLPYYFFDYTGTDPEGVIHLASAVLEGSLSGTGTLAVCHFSMVDFGISPLIFQDVDVRDPFNINLGFGHSTGDRIVIDPVVDVQERNFGHIKAIYR